MYAQTSLMDQALDCDELSSSAPWNRDTETSLVQARPYGTSVPVVRSVTTPRVPANDRLDEPDTADATQRLPRQSSETEESPISCTTDGDRSRVMSGECALASQVNRGVDDDGARVSDEDCDDESPDTLATKTVSDGTARTSTSVVTPTLSNLRLAQNLHTAEGRETRECDFPSPELTPRALRDSLLIDEVSIPASDPDDSPGVALPTLVPHDWATRAIEVTVDGYAPSGRPKPQRVRHLAVADLDASLRYMQRRTREVQSITRATQPNSEHTSRLVKLAIWDAIKRLAQNLPPSERTAIEDTLVSPT